MNRDFADGSVAARVPAPLLVVAAILTILIGHATAKHLLTTDTVFGLVFLRNLLAAAMLLAVVRPRVFDLDRGQWANAIAFGITIAVFNSLFYLVIPRIPLAIAVTISFLGPLAVGLIGARRPPAFVWPVLAFAGVLMLTPVGGVSDLDPLGVGSMLAEVADIPAEVGKLPPDETNAIEGWKRRQCKGPD